MLIMDRKSRKKSNYPPFVYLQLKLMFMINLSGLRNPLVFLINILKEKMYFIQIMKWDGL